MPPRTHKTTITPLQAVANPTRIEILIELTDGELTAGTIEAILEHSQSSLSQHLSILRQAGLVTARRDKTRRYYRLASDQAMNLAHSL